MNISKSERRRLRRKKRRQSVRKNASIKKKLCNNIAMAPCCYCNVVFLVDDLTVEHIMPKCLGGTNDLSNIALACSPCNSERGKIAFSIRKQQMRERYKDYKNGC